MITTSTKNIVASLNESITVMKNLTNITQDIKKLTSSLEDKLVNPASSSVKGVNMILEDLQQKLDAIDGTIKENWFI